jgi:hypothetical protein
VKVVDEITQESHDLNDGDDDGDGDSADGGDTKAGREDDERKTSAVARDSAWRLGHVRSVDIA